MLGHRGCRLGITYPEITEMQARAIIEAACQLNKEGLKVVPEIMIPLVGHVEEFKRPEGDRRARRPGGAWQGRHGRQDQVPDRHDDRGAARRGDGRRDRDGGRVLLVRHQRPHADDASASRATTPASSCSSTRSSGSSTRTRSSASTRSASGSWWRSACKRAAARAGPQARRLRRARRRPGVDPLLPEGRLELRVLLAVPRADRAAGGGAGGAGGQGRRLAHGCRRHGLAAGDRPTGQEVAAPSGPSPFLA